MCWPLLRTWLPCVFLSYPGQELGASLERIEGRLNGLRESNPMMGLRGCRLGIVHPEITETQVGRGAGGGGGEVTK